MSSPFLLSPTGPTVFTETVIDGDLEVTGNLYAPSIISSGPINSLSFFPTSWWEGLQDHTDTRDTYPILQELLDEAAAVGRNVLINRAWYRFFGELWSNGISIEAEGGALLISTRDDLAGLVFQGEGQQCVNLRFRGIYATPAVGPNPAGSRIQRNATIPPYNVQPYLTGGLARQPFRDRNAAIWAGNCDGTQFINCRGYNYNIGSVWVNGNYVATTVDPGIRYAVDWNADQTFGTPDDGKQKAEIRMPPLLWQDGAANVTTGNNIDVINCAGEHCDQGVFFMAQNRARLHGFRYKDITYIQTSPPHGVYWTHSAGGRDYWSTDCEIIDCYGEDNPWSAGVKLEYHKKSVFKGIRTQNCYAGIYSSANDDCLFEDIQILDINNPFTPLTGTWTAFSQTVSLSDTSGIVPGMFIGWLGDSSGLPTPTEVETVVDSTTITITVETFEASPAANFTGSISSNILNVTLFSSGSHLEVGFVIASGGNKVGVISSFGTGSGTTGTYNLIEGVNTGSGPLTLLGKRVFATTGSGASDIIFNLGGQRNTYQNIIGSTAPGVQDYVFGIHERPDNIRRLTRYAHTSVAALAGATELKFSATGFPVGPDIGWLVRGLDYFIDAGTTITSIGTAAGTVTVGISGALLNDVPVGTWFGFYQEIVLTTTAASAAGSFVLTFGGGTTGLTVLPRWYVTATDSINTGTVVTGVTATTVNIGRALRGPVEIGTQVTFRSDLWDDWLHPDYSTINNVSMQVERSSPTIIARLYSTTGSHSTITNWRTISLPIDTAKPQFSMYQGGTRKRAWDNRVITPTLQGLTGIIDLEPGTGGVQVTADSVQLQNGTTASTVRDQAGVLYPSVFVLDGVYEGTFTPDFFGSVIVGENTYSSQQGFWSRSRNEITCNLNLSLTAFFSTGIIKIDLGDMFPAAIRSSGGFVPVFCTGITLLSGYQLVARMLTGVTPVLDLTQRNNTGTDVTINGGQFSGSAFFTGTITVGGTLLTVSAVTYGTLSVGQVISTGSSIIGTIASLGTGSGGTGTYNLTGGVDTGSSAMSASGGTTTGRVEISFTFKTNAPFGNP